jgi:hypothetical protein
MYTYIIIVLSYKTILLVIFSKELLSIPFLRNKLITSFTPIIPRFMSLKPIIPRIVASKSTLSKAPRFYFYF